MCQVLEVSRSGYYDWKDRLPSKREQENQAILKIAQKSYQESRGMCGLDKILADVRENTPIAAVNDYIGYKKGISSIPSVKESSK